MPRKFRQLFKTQGLTARVYRRQTSSKLKHYNYEIRLRSDIAEGFVMHKIRAKSAARR